MQRHIENNLLFINNYKDIKTRFTKESSFDTSLINNCLIGSIDGECEAPLKPQNGFYYISPNKKLTGEWANVNQSNAMIAFFLDGKWNYVKPQDGIVLWSKTNKKIYAFGGGKWRPI